VARNAEPPRITGTERQVLTVLLRAGISKELYGLELLDACDGLTRASIYTVLDRIEAKGLIESRRESAPASKVVPAPYRLPRRLFRITGHGQATLAADEAARDAYARALSGLCGA